MAEQAPGALIRTIRLGAAPVIEGIKASNLVCFSRHGSDLDAAWHRWGPATAVALGLEHRVLRRSEVSTQVLFYRPEAWNRMLGEEHRISYLSRFGYDPQAAPACLLEEFCRRCPGGVPHEVGCFLDYPVADVQGFIDHQGKGGLFAGWWRVYADPRGARRQFRAIDEARRNQTSAVPSGF